MHVYTDRYALISVYVYAYVMKVYSVGPGNILTNRPNVYGNHVGVLGQCHWLGKCGDREGSGSFAHRLGRFSAHRLMFMDSQECPKVCWLQ